MYFPAFEDLGLPEWLCIAAVLGFVLLIVNYFLTYLPASKLKTPHLRISSDPPPVTVIVCARNEDENIPVFLPKVLEQKYHEFEVVVVNDCSWDNTGNVVDELAKKYPNLRKADIKEDAYYKHGKKFAMLVGIKSAKYKHLVFTDADCYPDSEQWLAQMAAGFTDQDEIVLGYGAYEKKPGFLNTLIRYDAFVIAVQYLSAAIRHKPYMGVGRNLAYTSDLFFRNKGFASHYHLNSGDDDLFVNEAATSGNTNVCLSAQAVTRSKPKASFKEWRLQKARHLTTSPHYKGSSRSLLLFNHFSQYFFYLTLIGLAFTRQTLLLIPILLILKAALQILLLRRVSSKLAERDLLGPAPFYELILLVIYPIFQATRIFYKPGQWTR